MLLNERGAETLFHVYIEVNICVDEGIARRTCRIKHQPLYTLYYGMYGTPCWLLPSLASRISSFC